MKVSLKNYSVEDLLFELNLYNRIHISIEDYTEITNSILWDNDVEMPVYETHYSEDFQRLIDFLNWETKFHGYCPRCRRETLLEPIKLEIDEKLSNSLLQEIRDIDMEFIHPDDMTIDFEMSKRLNLLLQTKILVKSVNCIYDPVHEFMFIYKFNLNETNNTLEFQKIGQYPSSSDFSKQNVDEYRKLMLKLDCYNDLVNAVRLNALGMGVGALAYLRRVLEKVIDRVYEDEKSNLDISPNEFKVSTMNTRVKLLKDYLPEFLTSNGKNIYALLSIGVHSLNEEQAKEIYPDLEIAILRILNEKQAKIRDQELKNGNHRALNNHATRISEDFAVAKKGSNGTQ